MRVYAQAFCRKRVAQMPVLPSAHAQRRATHGRACKQARYCDIEIINDDAYMPFANHLCMLQTLSTPELSRLSEAAADRGSARILPELQPGFVERERVGKRCDHTRASPRNAQGFENGRAGAGAFDGAMHTTATASMGLYSSLCQAPPLDAEDAQSGAVIVRSSAILTNQPGEESWAPHWNQCE